MWGKQKSEQKNQEPCDPEKVPSENEVKTAEQNAAESAEADAEKKDGEKEEKTPEQLLNEKIAQLEKKAAESERLRLLALAEMDNQRKRHVKELENVRYNVTQDTLFPFLQVFDHFTMAVKAADATLNLESLKKGMEMIQQEFDKAFSDLSVEKIDATGKDFDPNLHEAIAQKPSEDVPAGKILQQWSMGYKIGDRLLKPAVVVVSSGPEKKAEEQTEEKKDAVPESEVEVKAESEPVSDAASAQDQEESGKN